MTMIPVPASSLRAATPEESEAFIDEWIKDIALHFPEFAPNAQAYAEALCVMGYASKSSLSLLHFDARHDAIQELQDGLGLPRGMAKRLLNEALALHPRNELVPSTSPPVTATSIKPFPPWTERMTGTHICCYHELLRWLTTLLCFVEAHSGLLGPLLRLFMKDPGMNDADYKLIHDQISEWLQRQLAATILSSIPSAMAKLILSSLPDTFAADGLDILRAICRPHYGATALKVKIEQATDLCFTNVPSVTHRNQLQLALNAHLQSLEYLQKHGQAFGEDMAIRGLMILVQHLPLATEIEAAKSIFENADKTWTLPDLTKILQ